MSKLTCPVCKNKTYNVEVRVIHNNKCVHKDDSFLEAEKWAESSGYSKCIIRTLRFCDKCEYEQLISDRVFKSNIFGKD